jgi:ElaB/YqjD/DUF883 family membrane-anchored ribosome-binding protein
MQDNPTSGPRNGESVRESASHLKDRLRSRASAAGDAVRDRAENAKDWARSQLDGLQSRVEAQPYRATAWALGVGLVVGVALATLIRGGSRR